MVSTGRPKRRCIVKHIILNVVHAHRISMCHNYIFTLFYRPLPFGPFKFAVKHFNKVLFGRGAQCRANWRLHFVQWCLKSVDPQHGTTLMSFVNPCPRVIDFVKF